MEQVIVEKFDGFEIRQLSNGYLNITDMCKIAGKQSGHYFESKKAKDFVNIVAKDLGKSVKELLYFVAKWSHRGTWAHPRIAINVAQWISPAFSAKISIWIEEWYTSSEQNETKLFYELHNLESSESDQMELRLKLRLKEELNAEAEVKTPVGYIDLLTDEYIIEIKDAPRWKHALGQILSYSEYYPNHKRKIILFGQSDGVDTAVRICGKYEVIIEVVDCGEEEPEELKEVERPKDLIGFYFRSVSDLQKICRDNEWKGWSGLNKQNLERFVSEKLSLQ